MGFEKYEISNMINVAEEKLSEFVEYNKEISVHLHGKDMSVRDTFIIDNFKINENGLSIISDWFELNEECEIVKLELVDEENSLYIKFINGDEIFIDQ